MVCLSACLAPWASQPAIGEAANLSIFPDEVGAALKAHCIKCHGPEKQKSDIRFDTLSTDFIGHRAAAETWHDALNALHLGEMPPEDEPELSSKERQILVDWIRANLEKAIAKGSGEGVVMRRLNKAEYRYTMSDLLGVEAAYGSQLPSDPLSKDGFLNNGATLGMSALQLEFYLASAREALARILMDGDPPQRRSQRAEEPEKINGVLPGVVSSRLGRVNYWAMKVKNPPRSGRFTIRVKAKAEPVDGRAAPFLHVQYGSKVSGATALIANAGFLRMSDTESQVYEFHGWAEYFPIIPTAGEKLQQVVIIHNSLDDGEPPPKMVKVKRKKTYPEDPDFPKIIIESVEFIANDHEIWPPAPHRRILFAAEDDDSPEYAAEVLRRFMRRAWRRPPTAREVKTYQRHFERMDEQLDSRVEAFRETLSVVLAAPGFLYQVVPQSRAKRRQLNDHELVSRLSYFLWSSMPDERLMTLSDRKQMRRPKVLLAEVERMLADEKSERFIEQFTTQWLDLDGVKRVAVNPEFHPDFDTKLEPYMVRETQLFFREILRNDESALRLLDADFTMVNAALAKHYGLSGPQSQVFERVSLVASRRPGGLLAHGAMHLANSNGEDSHPIKRAVWIRERLLHDPPAPPPPNVPSLDPSNPDFAKLPIRKQLEIHRQDPACADCHRGIDPWGIALENFDAVGKWRDEIRRPTGERIKKKPQFTTETVDSRTKLPGGHAINGVEGLKAFLLNERRDQFAHAFVTKLATYALGRSLGLADQAELEKLSQQFAADGYRISALIADIAASELFLNR